MIISCHDPTSMSFNDAYQRHSSWYLDNSCKSNMCKDWLFTAIHSRTHSKRQFSVDTTSKITGKWRVKTKVINENVFTNFALKNTLCVLELNCNLISIAKCTLIISQWILKIDMPKYVNLMILHTNTSCCDGDLCYVYGSFERFATA